MYKATANANNGHESFAVDNKSIFELTLASPVKEKGLREKRGEERKRKREGDLISFRKKKFRKMTCR